MPQKQSAGQLDGVSPGSQAESPQKGWPQAATTFGQQFAVAMQFKLQSQVPPAPPPALPPPHSQVSHAAGSFGQSAGHVQGSSPPPSSQVPLPQAEIVVVVDVVVEVEVVELVLVEVVGG